ncbi:hypothetical protein E2C01_036193 [Portunus trituberculatus]|uniref:Uncharacterized protein n=1 Tax=Portunus trituberculatus TaxID=210409 RepID=A0A5B7F659_PORTR|nr:hypothetical protein [Portunus trituberculatus]
MSEHSAKQYISSLLWQTYLYIANTHISHSKSYIVLCSADAHLRNLPVHLFYVLEEIVFGGAEGRLISGVVGHGGGDGLHLRSVG